MIEAEQQQQSNVFSSPMDKYASNLHALTNPEPLIDSMEMTFRGQKRDSNGRIIQVGSRLMNEEGINSITGEVRSLVNQVAIMSHLEDKKVSDLILSLSDTIIKDLLVNSVRYEITIPIARDRILTIATTTAYMAARRAWQGGERSFWKGGVMEVTNRSIQGNEKKGLLGNLFGD